jgi:hypothetical protein
MPRAMKKAIRLACTAPMEAPRLCPMEGRAGRYMSIAKGPMADSRPSTSAVPKNEDFIAQENTRPPPTCGGKGVLAHPTPEVPLDPPKAWALILH